MKRVSDKRRRLDLASIATAEQYRDFKNNTQFPWCWFCGRDDSQCPEWWHAPWFIQRSHIVSSPRAEDVRLINLMCPWCHMVEHGIVFGGALGRPQITTANMLWIKERFDPANYAPDFMKHFSVKRLPTPEAPADVYLAEYRVRRYAPEFAEAV